MKINKLFHSLYAFLMGLPLLSSLWIGLIWTFNENAQVPTITENVSKEVDFNQLVKNGDFFDNSYWGVTRGSLSTNNNIGSVTVNTASYDTTNLYQSFIAVSGHIYFQRCFVKVISCNVNPQAILGLSQGSTMFGVVNNPVIGTTYKLERVSMLDSNMTNLIITYDKVNAEDYGVFEISNVIVVDLTQMFGEGNEPSLTEFNNWFTDDYYDYTLSKHIVIENYSTRQVLDSPVNYIWLPSFGGMGWTIQNVFNSMVDGMFGLATSYGIGFTIVKLLTYWLCISLIWLIYDVIMYVPLMIHRWLDKGVIS